MKISPDAFADFLRKQRLTNGLKQSELADKIGVSRTAITKIENKTQQPNFFVAWDWITTTNAREAFIAMACGTDLAALATAITQLIGG